MDLTPIRFLGRKTKSGAAATGQMWVATGPEGDVVHHWRLSKQAAEADSIIPEYFNGTNQCWDGGSEMACWMKGGKERRRPPPNGVRGAGCLAHFRQKFDKAWQDSGQECKTSHEFRLLIADLYAVEEEARASGVKGKDYHAVRLASRQARSIAPMARLKTRLDEELRKHLPKSNPGRAITYALNQWTGLQIYLEDGRCEPERSGDGRRQIDDNPVENANRPSAVG